MQLKAFAPPSSRFTPSLFWTRTKKTKQNSVRLIDISLFVSVQQLFIPSYKMDGWKEGKCPFGMQASIQLTH